MTRKESTFRRILVAVDDTEQIQSVLEYAALLATLVRAELAGLLVEDEDLLQLAHLPFASEISRCSGAARILEPLSVERQLRLRADRMRKALRRIETEHRLRTSLEVIRGRLAPEAVFAHASADVVFIVGRRQHVESKKAARRASTRHVAPICVLYDHSESAARALEVGANLSASMDARLIVMFPGGAESPREASKGLQARQELLSQNIQVQLVALGVNEALGDLIRRQHCRVLVLPMPRTGAAEHELDFSMLPGTTIALVR